MLFYFFHTFPSSRRVGCSLLLLFFLPFLCLFSFILLAVDFLFLAFSLLFPLFNLIVSHVILDYLLLSSFSSLLFDFLHVSSLFCSLSCLFCLLFANTFLFLFCPSCLTTFFSWLLSVVVSVHISCLSVYFSLFPVCFLRSYSTIYRRFLFFSLFLFYLLFFSVLLASLSLPCFLIFSFALLLLSFVFLSCLLLTSCCSFCSVHSYYRHPTYRLSYSLTSFLLFPFSIFHSSFLSLPFVSCVAVVAFFLCYFPCFLLPSLTLTHTYFYILLFLLLPYCLLFNFACFLFLRFFFIFYCSLSVLIFLLSLIDSFVFILFCPFIFCCSISLLPLITFFAFLFLLLRFL